MSLNLYTVRIFWDGRRGCLLAHGVHLCLIGCPRDPGLPTHLEEIDYAPEANVAQLRERADRWRDMTLAERCTAELLLDALKD